MTEHFVPEARVLALAGHPETFARVHVTDPGAPTVLLSHGWLASADLNWYALYGALAERANFVAIDHRGHGRGAHSVEPFTLVDAADDAAALLDHLGVGPVVVAGYSMGGPIGLHLASRRPDLVSGLVLVSTALRFSGGFRDRLLWWARGATGLALRWRAQGRLFRRIVDRVSAEDELTAAWRGHLLGEVRRGSTDDFLAAARDLRGFDGASIAARLTVPTATVVSRRDRVVPPRRQRELAAALGGAVVELDADHDAFVRNTAAYAAAVLDALDRVGVGAGDPAQPTTARPS